MRVDDEKFFWTMFDWTFPSRTTIGRSEESRRRRRARDGGLRRNNVVTAKRRRRWLAACAPLHTSNYMAEYVRSSDWSNTHTGKRR
ncbi:hypothetical protein EVAR_77548_1 [Eumeta japonica]|uniref:Uncharacterized protein n=1 Tax=Eumeta variegata TaxID=151549 RepID=A0A4C1T9Z9_EUMVA|nr:hypothetical protein EVAR_77548_1 [Eumeta japonica]